MRLSTDMLDARHVAVYGTLRRSGWNYPLLKRNGLKYAGTYTVTGFELRSLHKHRLSAVPGAIVSAEPDSSIVVELYSGKHLTDREWQEAVAQLDWLEGHPNVYRRIEVDIDGIRAFMYEYRRVPTGPAYPGGDWAAANAAEGGR